MPRGPRIDAPNATHHVMLRGIERRRIFVDSEDCEALLGRLERLVPELGFRCFAWALMPNHLHLALQTGPVSVSKLMARLGTGYAGHFNRRHGRVGHLFQNRFRSRLVADEDDLLNLVLYIHRNPIEASLVGDVAALARFPWCGHGALMGKLPPRAFESPGAALRLFAKAPDEARRRLSLQMEAPVDQAEPGPPTGTVSHPKPSPPRERRTRPGTLDDLLRSVCETHSVSLETLCASRSGRAVAARAELSLRATCELGLSSRSVARALGVSDSTISRALAWKQRKLRKERPR